LAITEVDCRMVADAVEDKMIETFDVASEFAQLRHGGEAAVAELFEHYRQMLVRMIVVRLDNRLLGKVDVEDILQDAFLEAARRVDDYLDRPSVPFYVWLRQIALQASIDAHRRYVDAQMRDVNRETSLFPWACPSESSALLAAELADSLTTPSQCAVRNEMVSELKESLEKLDEIDREILVLRHLEELSNREAAEVLGIHQFAASKRYLRALERLRNVMSVVPNSVARK
jgi:RNA polymerase sigma-70 factor (ECF subfamily)